jgi:hypothetical protein
VALAVTTLLGCGGGSGGASGDVTSAEGTGAPGEITGAVSPSEKMAGASGESCECHAGANATRMPLSCFCADARHAGLCALDLAHVDPATAEICPRDGLPIVRKTGCGRVSFELGDISFEDSSPVFDQATGQLIGLYAASDIPVEACGVWQVLYGRGLFETRFSSSLTASADVCPQIESCTFCGESTMPNAPPPCP